MKVYKLLYKHLGGGNSRIKVLFALTFSISTLLFTSCDNFSNGSHLLDQIQKEIEYAKATSYKIRVSADSGTGVINTGSGDNDMKVSDSLTVSFSKDKSYKFIKWQAVQKDDNSVSMADCVTFDDDKALETVFTLVKDPESDILIKPLCTPTLSVTGKYPIDSAEGSERDSTVKFTFTDPLSDTNDLSRIQISISGSSADGHYNFQDPIIEDNQLIIMAKTENRIEVPEGTTKSVTVTIPADFTYVSNAGELEIGEEISHTYTINSTTCDKTFITFGTNDEESGSVKVNGLAASAVSQQYSIGESVTVTFKLADGYEFVNWECSDEGAILLKLPNSEDNPDYNEDGFNKSTNIATATLLIINQAKNVTFKAITQKIPTANIKIYLPQDDSGVLKVNGVIANGEAKTYRKGDKITVTFKKNEAFKFINWSNSDADEKAVSVDYGDYADTYGYDNDTKTSTVEITIIGGSDETITFSPIAPEIDKSYISAESQHGRFSINITDSYKEGDSQTLGFTSDPDFQFICWEIYKVSTDGKTKTLLQNGEYIKIEKPDEANTKFSLDKALLSHLGTLEIKPVCEERPKVVSATPLDDPDGVYRDRTIIVKFSKEMDESSVYWTAEELKAKIGSLENAFKVDENMEDDKAMYYSYWDGVNDSSYTFKNITITKYTDSSVNLLQYYGIPQIDSVNKRVLRLPTKIVTKKDAQGHNVTESIAPPSATEILVTVNKDVCYLKNDKQIYMSGDYQWSYYTNGGIDNDPPTFVDSVGNAREFFTVTFASDDQTSYKEGDDVVVMEETDNNFDPVKAANFDIKTYSKFNLHENKRIWVRGSFTDTGSGPASLKWTVNKVHSKFYPLEENEATEIQKGQISLTVMGSTKASINPNLNNDNYDIGGVAVTLDELEKEGFYSIEFTASDKNGREAKKTYYFVYDHETVNKPNISGISNERFSYDKETIKWTNPSDSDFDHIYVERWLNDRKEFHDAKNNVDGKAATSQNFTELEDRTRYEYRFYNMDICGNKSAEYVSWQDDKGPTTLVSKTGLNGSRKTKNTETVTWTTNPSGSDVSHILVKKYEGTTYKDSYEIALNASPKSKDFTNLTLGKKYEYRFYSVDYAGNLSETYTPYTDNSAPSNILNFYSGGSDKAVTLFWDNPSDEDFYFTEMSTGTSHSNPVEIITDKNTHNFKKQTQSYNDSSYTYSFRTCDYSGNYSEYMTVTTGYSGVRVGDICYERDLGNGKYEISCSNKVYKNIPELKPVGVVLDIQGKTGTITSSGKTTTDSTKYKQTRIMSVKNIDSTSYIWGKCGDDTNAMKSQTHAFDGLLNYNYYKENYKAQTFDYTGGYVASTGDANIKTVWYYIENDKRVKEPYLEWYLPAVDELKICAGNSYNTAFATINTLISNGFDVDGAIANGKLWITSTSTYSNNYHFFRLSYDFANQHDNGDYEYRDRRLCDRIVCLAQYDFSSSYTPVK